MMLKRGISISADIVDVAIDSMSGLTSQPSMGAVIGALQGTEQDTGIALENAQALNSYWEQIRLLYSCFDPGLKSGDSGVYIHEMPGGQYTNLLFQSQQLGLGESWNGMICILRNLDERYRSLNPSFCIRNQKGVCGRKSLVRRYR